MSISKSTGAALLLVVAISCSTTPEELDPRIHAVADPADGPPVALVSVEDARHFRAGAESRPDLPAVLDASQLGDPATLVRIVGGAFEGDTLRREVKLAGGRTIEDVAAELLTASFRLGGLRVVDPGTTPGAADVVARIDELWIADDGHALYRGLRITLVDAPPPLPDGHAIEVAGGYQHLPFVSRKAWDAALQHLLAEATDRLVRDLRDGPDGAR